MLCINKNFFFFFYIHRISSTYSHKLNTARTAREEKHPHPDHIRGYSNLTTFAHSCKFLGGGGGRGGGERERERRQPHDNFGNLRDHVGTVC